MRFVVASATLTAALIGAVVLATGSHAAGLTGLHAQAQIGNRICMVDHYHHGQSGAWATKEKAVAVAAQSWGSFTALEYGDEWADFNQAHHPDVQCEQVASERGGALWSCNVKAKPCRPSAPVYSSPIPHAPRVVHRHAPHVRVQARARSVVVGPAPYAHHPHHAHHGSHGSMIWPGDKR